VCVVAIALLSCFTSSMAIEVRIENSNFGNLRYRQFVTRCRPTYCLWRRSVVNTERTFAIRRHVRMDPSGAFFSVVIDDRTAKIGANIVWRDAQAVGKLSFNQVARHGHLRCWLGAKGVENRAARDACLHRQNCPICTEGIPILDLDALRTIGWTQPPLGGPNPIFERPLYSSNLKYRSTGSGRKRTFTSKCPAQERSFESSALLTFSKQVRVRCEHSLQCSIFRGAGRGTNLELRMNSQFVQHATSTSLVRARDSKHIASFSGVRRKVHAPVRELKIHRVQAEAQSFLVRREAANS
jgi:hypothetical protein